MLRKEHLHHFKHREKEYFVSQCELLVTICQCVSYVAQPCCVADALPNVCVIPYTGVIFSPVNLYY